MKQLHFTGRSHWEGKFLITNITPDFGYMLMFKNDKKQFSKIITTSKSYEEQNKKLFTEFVAVRDFRQGGNNEVCLMSEKKLNNWLSKHNYDKIEL